MKLKRICATALAMVMTVGVMTGCGSTETTETTDDTAQTTDTADTESTGDVSLDGVHVEFWHAMSGKQQEVLTELTDQFNAENEFGITVDLVNQGAYNDLSTKLTANAAAGTLPDMAQTYNNWIVPYIDMVVPLDDFIANDFDNYEDIIPSYRDEVSEFGFIHGLPFNKSTYLYFYNKTMFDELGLTAPETWDDLVHIGEVFKSEKDMVSLGYDDLSGMLEAYIRQNGGEYIDADGVLFDDEKGLETITFIMDLYNNGYARLAGEDGYFSTPMSNQLIPAYVGSSAGVSYIDTSAGWELGVAPLPGNVEKAANQSGTNLVMFAQDEAQQLATWEYMKFLTSTEATTYWAMNTGYLPIRTSAYESAEYQDFMANDLAAQAAYAQADAFFCPATFENSYETYSLAGTTLEELILENADGQTAYDELVQVINDNMK